MDATDALVRDEVPVDNLIQEEPEVLQDLLEPVEDENESYAGMLDFAQNERGVRVEIDRSRDSNLTQFGKETLTDRYLMPGESYQDLFARVAVHFADDSEHA